MSAKQKVTAGITTVEEVLRVLPRTAFSRSRSLDKEPALVQAIE
jgi:hypothetical protein